MSEKSNTSKIEALPQHLGLAERFGKLAVTPPSTEQLRRGLQGLPELARVYELPEGV